jgi:hypothetical protein
VPPVTQVEGLLSSSSGSHGWRCVFVCVLCACCKLPVCGLTGGRLAKQQKQQQTCLRVVCFILRTLLVVSCVRVLGHIAKLLKQKVGVVLKPF